MRRRSLFTFGFWLLAFGFAAAQQPQTPTFRAGAVLVTVDAYPQQNGRIVEGLTPEDFDVLEDGKPQKVENFQFVRVQPALTDDERKDPNSGDDGNRQAADPRSRVFVAFLDLYHVAFDGSHATRKPLVDTLRTVMSDSDLFGVMTPKMRPQQLTLGRKLLTLENELATYWPWGERFSLLHDPEEDYLARCLGGIKLPDALVRRRREDRTLTAIEGLVAQLGRIREARTVVLLFTDGYLLYEPDRQLAEDLAKAVNNTAGGPPIPGIYRTPQGPAMMPTVSAQGDVAACSAELQRLAMLDDLRRFRDLIAEANRRNVSFYPVNPSGLAVFDTPLSEAPVPIVVDMDRVKSRVSNLRTLAENTDGIAVVETNDLSGGIKKVVNDVSAYYLLGYYSANTKMDGSYHRIQVRMKRPGLNVRARRGYFAPVAAEEAARASKATSAAANAPVTDALAALSKLNTAADVYAFAAPRAAELTLVVEIPSARADAGAFAQGAEVEAAIAGVLGGSPVRGRIEAGSRAAMLAVPMSQAGAGPWRIDVRVRAGGEQLEDRVTIDAAPPAALVGAPIAYRAAPGPRSPIRPVADFQFRRTERVHVEWPILKALDARQARLLGRTGQPLAVGVTLTERPEPGQPVLAADVNLAPLSAGDYVLELTAGSGAETERRLLAIRVLQ